ncbi:MAG: PorP/SprF family type IX secretion system membrane protein [Bacteroidetes bacterium]|nr:PorP/SprF family type IX secretion system membrane protein [Bacteroidota bacterium]
MKRILYIVFLFVVAVGSAQQLPQYSQYMLNEMAINPAVAGRDQYPEVRSNNRYQWAGITDAPRTYMLTLQGPIQEKNMGLGMNLYTDIVGPTRRTGLTGTYAYHLQLNEKKMFLSMGLSAGVLQWGVDGSKITLHDDGDQQLLSQYQTAVVPDLGAGLYFYQKDKFYVGLSVPQMYNAPLAVYTHNSKSKIVSQLNINGAYTFSLGTDFKIEPSFLLKYEKPTPMKVDVGARFIYQDQIWLGTTYRHKDAMSFLIGYMFNNYLMVGYSYDVTTTKIKNYTSGSNEIMLGIRFSRKQSPTWESQQKEKESYKSEEISQQPETSKTEETTPTVQDTIQTLKVEETTPAIQDTTQTPEEEESGKSAEDSEQTEASKVEETKPSEEEPKQEESPKVEEIQQPEDTTPVEETPKAEEQQQQQDNETSE